MKKKKNLKKKKKKKNLKKKKKKEWPSSKRLEITSVGGDVEKREPLCAVGRNVNWYNHYAK